jgi:urease accessory protein
MSPNPSRRSMAPITPMGIESQQLLLLLAWMSPTFPTGAFAYSHGLEWAIEDGIVQSADDLKAWIEDVITRGSGWNDAVLFSRCWEDDAGELNELALALTPSKERHLETVQLGRAFAIAAAVYNCFQQPSSRRKPGPPESEQQAIQRVENMQWVPAFAGMTERGDDESYIAYPVAAGTTCAGAGIERPHALLAFLQGFSSALVSVAVRLVPLGQTQGLTVIRDLMPIIAATAHRAASARLGDLGTITIAADIAAMKHETQHSRIFRT